MIIFTHPEIVRVIQVTTERWLWAVDCHTYKPALLAVRCEQMLLNDRWRLPRVAA